MKRIAASVCLQYQGMVNEIEIDLQQELPIRHGPRRQPAYGWVERHIPGMVDWRSESKPHFADNLGPQLERNAAFTSLCLRQRWPRAVWAFQCSLFGRLHVYFPSLEATLGSTAVRLLPILSANSGFWSGRGDRLRHPRFVALRVDNKSIEVVF